MYSLVLIHELGFIKDAIPIIDTVGEFIGGATRRERMTSGKLEEKRCSRD
jgi:hypothetical protein